MSVPQIETVLDNGLGNASYLVDLGDGRALTVDASRDLRAISVSAASRGLSVVYAADTHLLTRASLGMYVVDGEGRPPFDDCPSLLHQRMNVRGGALSGTGPCHVHHE